MTHCQNNTTTLSTSISEDLTSDPRDKTLLNKVEDCSSFIIKDPTSLFQNTNDASSSYLFEDPTFVPIQDISSHIVKGPVSLIANNFPCDFFQSLNPVVNYNPISDNIKNLSSDIIKDSVFSSLIIQVNSAYILQVRYSCTMAETTSTAVNDHSFHPVEEDSWSDIPDWTSTIIKDPTYFISPEISFF